MADRRQADYWIDFGDENAPRSVKDRARWHEGRRQRAIASILLELHLMAVTEIIPLNTRSFGMVKAHWQDDFGSEEDETHAAHCVPRQLIIRSRHPHDLLRPYSPDRSDYLQGFFAKTDILPVNFNKCDSRCERIGLVNGFRLACLSAIASGHASPDIKFGRVSTSVRIAFEHYKAAARFVFQASAQRLSKKLVFPKPLPHNERKWKQQLAITEGYAQELRYSSAINTITRLGEMDDLVKHYREV